MLQSWAPAHGAGGEAVALAGHAGISASPVKWNHTSLVEAAVPMKGWVL